jgi:hypothetical protein
MQGSPVPWDAAGRAKLELVRQRLTDLFPNVRVRVRDPGSQQPVAFMLRSRDCRDVRLRVAWGRFHDDAAGELVPAEALHALAAGESVLVTHDGSVLLESVPDWRAADSPEGSARGEIT